MGKSSLGIREWKPGLPSLCVALGLNLAQARQHCTTERESQHLSLFTFYFKTKLLAPELFGEVPDWLQELLWGALPLLHLG